MENRNNPLSAMMQDAMGKVREMVDSNTIVGQPIQTADGVTLIPISKVSFGFGGGGGDYGGKGNPPAQNVGAGIASGVKISPVAFLVVKEGTVRVLPIAVPAVSTADRLVEMVPDLVDKFSGFIKKNQENTPETGEEF